MILDDFLPREKVKANSYVIKVRQTSSIILIHGRSRGSFSRRRIFRASCIPRNSFVLENDWMIYHHVYYSPRLFLALWTREDNKIIIYELRLSKLCFPSLQFSSPSKTIRILIFPPVRSKSTMRALNERAWRHTTRILIDIWKRKIRHDTPPPSFKSFARSNQPDD